MDTPENLKSRLYRLQQHNEEDIWVEKCQGYPVFKKEENIFKLKFFSLPSRELSYDIVVNSNVRFDRNQNGVEWIQIREGEIMAISFKEEFHANAFWNLIDDYQHRYEVSVPAASGTHFYFEYRVPDPTVDNLTEFLAELERIPEGERHERLTSIFLTKREFLPRLSSVFKQLEKMEPLPRPRLELMFTILRIIFNSSNEELLYELMCDQFFTFVLGGLEYDPNFKNAPPKHRDFMRYRSKLISVVPFKNQQLLNLSIITYRLEYVRECVLLPYLNDYSFTFTSHIIRNNYRKILSHIFSPKKKDFINDLFDHLRKQDPMAFKLLREIFRIGKSFYAEDLYLHIAERDFFDIMVRSMKDLKSLLLQDKKPEPESNSQQQQPAATAASTSTSTANKFKKKRKPEDIAVCVEISIEILEQFMQFQPLHFKNYCVSEAETVNKYPTINFLLEQFEQDCPLTGQKIDIILRILISDKQNHAIKAITHSKILDKFLESDSLPNLIKWVPLFTKVLTPPSVLVKQNFERILATFLNNLMVGPKEHQINMLQTLKILISTYIDSQEAVTQYIEPVLPLIAKLFIQSKGALGIRMSIFLSIFKPAHFKPFNKILIEEVKKSGSCLVGTCLVTLQGFITRQDISLPSNLRRDRSEQLKDDECFENIEKMIKID